MKTTYILYSDKTKQIILATYNDDGGVTVETISGTFVITISTYILERHDKEYKLIGSL